MSTRCLCGPPPIDSDIEIAEEGEEENTGMLIAEGIAEGASSQIQVVAPLSSAPLDPPAVDPTSSSSAVVPPSS